ncbi:MAG: arginase family protein [Gammaproteobacteria bacterium]|nr:arginase family protein [Gammaproteobacteria bacterium]
MNLSLDNIRAYLCAPGSGVYTVFTGREKRQILQKQLYGVIDQEAEAAWSASLQEQLNQPNSVVLGICSDAGGGINRGANWGPLFVRLALYQHIRGWQPTELGDIRIIPQLLLDEYASDAILRSTRKALYDDENSARVVSPLSMTYECAKWFYEQYPNRLLLGIGGDHSCSYPLIRAYLEHKKQQQKRVAVVHFDAHTDMMTSRLGIPICFGSWTYHILPYLPAPDHLVQIGIRASGRVRQYWETQYGIRQFWAHEVIENGALAVAEVVIAHLKARQVDEIYITFDIDALDASTASATGTPETDGLTLDDALTLITALKTVFKISGADLMEVAPFIAYPSSNGEIEGSASTLFAAAKVLSQFI